MVVKSDVTVVVRVVGTVTVSVRSGPVAVDTTDSVVVKVPAVTVVVETLPGGRELLVCSPPPGVVVVLGSMAVEVVDDSDGAEERVPSWA